MRFEVRHATTYEYRRRVELGSHLAHLLPRPLAGIQRVHRTELAIDPTPSALHHALDHFGNRTACFTVETPHDRFEVVALSEVEVRFPPPPPVDATQPWEALVATLRDTPETALDAVEFAVRSARAPQLAAAAAYARPSFPAATPVLAGLLDLNRRIHRDFRFDAEATTLRTTVSEVLARRAGVCQDFTHLMISALRSLGLPARYVSGYIRTYPAAGTEKRAGSDVSHAWVEAWLGPGLGWVGLDPTNDIVVAEEHVVLAWGRDFSDISPLFGVILGGGRHTLKVAVDLRPLEGVAKNNQNGPLP